MNSKLGTIFACLLALFASPTLGQDFTNFQPKDFSKQISQGLKDINQVASSGPYKPDWKSLEDYEVPEWYLDAKFGIFIHWGVYTVPEFGHEWYPREMYINKDSWRGNAFKHHAEKYGSQNTFGYKDFIPMFKPTEFNAEEWVDLFEKAGAKYIVPVAEHHDGFPIYDCSYTQWSSAKMGPKRDFVAELEKATRAKGLKFGVSSHRAFNWLYYIRNENFDSADPKYSGLYGRPIPELFKEDAANYQKNWPAHDDQFKDEWLARTCELADKYNADLIWFDFGINNDKERPATENPFEDHLRRFAAYYYNVAAKKGQKPVLNYKWTAYPEKTAVLDLERSKLKDIRKLFWQTDTSVATNTWSYVEKIKYKTPDRIIDDLIDIVSKNGCLLMNVCPRADGSIPLEQVKMLTEFGNWLKVNGEAIYGSRPFKIFGEGPTATIEGHVSENKNKPFGAKDIRFTTKGEELFAIALGKPENNKLLITTMKSDNVYKPTIEKVEMLGHNGKLIWSQTDQGLEIEFPETLPCDFAFTFRIQ